MKKLLAILLSALMLCAMVPAISVAAADEYTIELVADAEEVNAGDEITIETSFYGHESVGLIAAGFELGFDPDVFELPTYYDEDEEMWMPPIEVGPKFSASSNKYITFSPIDEETGYMERCIVNFTRGTATASQAVKTNLFYTLTLKVKDDAPSGVYTIDIINYKDKNMVFYGNGWGEWTWEPITITVNGSEPEVPECEHEYEYDCSKNCKLCGEETRPEAEHQYFYACDPVCMICYEMTNPEAAHTMNHVEAKPATCTENGNIEYWYCDACGGCWDNENAMGMPLNRMMVIVPAAHTYDNDCDPDCNVCFENREELNHNVIHVEAVPATCTTEGNIEYWYCDVCGMAWLDEACTLNTNLLSVKLPASCSYSAVYTAAKEATCFEPGNVEYWYCANCDVYYADAACAIVTNAKNVIIPITHNIIHVEAKAATCTENGNIEYWYCDVCGSAWLDEYCHLNTNLKAVVLGATCSTNAVYTEAKAATCFEPGNVEYWYCANCDVYYLDAACTIITNAKSVILPIAHNVIYVEAKAPTCTENGNIEYWYCADCGSAWLDEYCHLNTNLKAVVLGATCSTNAVYTEAKAATCFEPGNVEYWYCANCDVYYLDAACTIITNAKSVILPIAHNVIHVEAKAPTCTENGNIEYWYCDVCGSAWLDELCIYNTNLKAVVLGATCSTNAVYTEAKAATCFEPGNVEYWYCANCDVYYLDAACTIITNAKSVILPIAHNVIHVEAKAPTCTENGNIEYWYCADCGQAWLDELCIYNTNLKAVVLGATCSTNAVYTEAKAATCFEPGNVEYWYCANCDVYYADAACTIITNAKNVIIPITHNIIAVEAKAATCTEMGNIAYWYCADCGQAWLDELCIYNTNLKAVVLPMADHTYDADNDADCNVCGAVREIAAEDIIVFGGNSVSEQRSGLAFKFDAAVAGIVIGEDYVADYANATVTIGGVEYKLVKMGAIMNNKGYENQTLDNVDGTYVLNVEAVKVFGEYSFAIRILNIPAEHLDTTIIARPYITYECDGELITVYGEEQAQSYNGALN